MTEQALSSDESNPFNTKWKNPPTLRNLKLDLSDAKPAHDAQKKKIVGWLDNLNVTGAAVINSPAGNSRIVPKVIRKQAEWRYAALTEPFLSTDDVFRVKPVTWEDRESAQQNQLVLNNQFNTKIEKTKFVDEFVRAAVDEGTVIVRVGWAFEEEEFTEDVQQFTYQPNPEFGETLQQVAQMQQTSPSQYATDVPDELKRAFEMSQQYGQPFEPVPTGKVKVTKTRTLRNCPTVEVCDFRNLVIDPTCLGDLDKASFAIYSFESSLSELEKDGKYKNLDKISTSSSSVLSEPDHASSERGSNFNFQDEPRKKLVVHEYWGFWDIDKTGMVKPIVVAWVGNTMIRMEENPYPDKKIPFVIEHYLPVRRAIYGEPDGVLIEDNQKVAGAVTRGMIDIMGKSANGQTGVRKDMLDTTNRRKFDKGQDYEFNVNVDPRAGVHMHTYPEIPNSAQFMLQLQNMEAESLTGVKSFSGGITGAGLGDVAAGVRGALDAASKRELGILRRLSSGMVKIGRKIISMNAEFLSDEEVVRITNEEFVTVRRDDLAGSFDLRLSISTAEEDNNKAEQLGFLLQTVGPNSDPDLVKMILSDIARLRKMPDLAKKIESYQPQPNPLAEEKAKLEVELLKAQINAENARADRDRAQAQLGGAKVGTEQAKTNHLKSDTDLKNLDFVEQESGVKQERDLQKQGEQARANAQLSSVQHEQTKELQKEDLLHKYLLSTQQ